MKKLSLVLLLTLLSVFGFGFTAQAESKSASPYDSVVGFSKDTTSAVDAALDSASTVDKKTVGKLADYLMNTSAWKKLSEQAQNVIGSNIGKLGPLVKKLGWIANALDLAPSVYNLAASYVQRDKQKFKESFRDTVLKTTSILTGLAIGAGVTAALPLVVAGTAATGGALLVVAAGGLVVTVGAGMLVDHIVKKTFSKSLEDFGGSLYDKLIGDDTLSSLQPSSSDGGGGGNREKSDGPVTLDALQW